MADKTTTTKAGEVAAEAKKPAKASSAKTAATKAAAQETASKPSTKTAAAKTTTAKTAATKTATAKKTAAKATDAKVAESKKAASKTTATQAADTKAAAAKTTDAKAAEKAKPAAKKATATKTSAKKSATTKAATAKKATTAKKETAAKAETKTAAAATTTKTTAQPSAAKKAAAKAEPAAKKEAAKTEPTAKKEVAAKKDAAAKKTEPAKKTAAAKATASAKTTTAKKATAAKKEAAAKKDVAAKAPAAKATAEKSAEAKPAAAKAPEPVKEEAPAKAAAKSAAKPASEFADIPGVLIAAAECAPLVKVGGLADVVGALPKYLRKLGIDARVIMPLHRQIKDKYYRELEHLCDFEARLGWRSQYVGLEKLELDGIVYYFIDNEFYFGGPIYCGGEFEGEQYAFFTRAVVDAIPQLDFNVGILHSNDWHTAMMPLLTKTQYQGGMQQGLKTLLTIHNLHFQGQFSHEFDRDLLGVDDSLATPQFVEHYGCDNMLKAGIVFADKVNTVSPTYAREICEPYLGESLDGVLRSRGEDLWGILNGIDIEEWDPKTDKYLPVNFNERNFANKHQVKEELLDELGLWRAPEGEDVPVIGMVTRLTKQKGIDLLEAVLDDIMQENVRMIVLGSGNSYYEDFLRDAERRYKGRLCSFIGYAGELSHRIYAGSDLFLMPSLFEPCGVSQMIAMRYGTLPIVRETGGLRDTVVPYNEFTGEGNGFSFANYNAHEMLGVIRYALSVWWNEDARKQLMKQAMASDFGMDRTARTYAELYRSML